MTSIKAGIPPGGFVPFQFKAVNNTAFRNAVEYICGKSETI
jgi:hypothetical protein